MKDALPNSYSTLMILTESGFFKDPTLITQNLLRDRKNMRSNVKECLNLIKIQHYMVGLILSARVCLHPSVLPTLKWGMLFLHLEAFQEPKLHSQSSSSLSTNSQPPPPPPNVNKKET